MERNGEGGSLEILMWRFTIVSEWLQADLSLRLLEYSL